MRSEKFPIEILERFRSHLASNTTPVPVGPRSGDAVIAIGQIRMAEYITEEGDLARRHVLIVDVIKSRPQFPELVEYAYEQDSVNVMLIHEYPELSTEDDVLIGPGDLSYPLRGAIQTTNQGPVLIRQVGPCVATLNDDLLDLVSRLNRGGRRVPSRSGLLVVDPDDRRIEFAKEEWIEMQEISADAWRSIFDPDPKMEEEILQVSNDDALRGCAQWGDVNEVDELAEIEKQLRALDQLVIAGSSLR